MTIASGSRLGPYEIVSRLGAGGMGEVWKARDTRIDRIVAIKTSHDRFTDRFAQEVRAIAALNHPHICTLYDVGPDYLVMEYVEGSEIKGPLPLDVTLKYAIQLAGALEAAHRKGITHRDLKPANILVTKAGIKVLDFGLAKFEQSKAAVANDQTLTRALTQEGSIVGTLQYMAPEQLQGKATDARSDFFSFGCVLYEMLIGKRAFDGANTASVIAGILEREPPAIGDVAPPSLDWLMRRCLAKDPDERWQTARDLRAALERISQVATEGVQTRTAPRIPWFMWSLAAAGISAAAILSAIHFRETPPETPVSLLVIEPPKDTHFADASGYIPVVSPDGRQIVFGATTADGKSQLWLRPLDSLTAQPLPGTDSAVYPFWSPDNKSLGFFAGGKLKKMTVSGGSPTALADASDALGGTWSRYDVVVFTPSPNGGLQQVSASGGAARSVIPPDPKISARFPRFLPDGKHFTYQYGTVGSLIRIASLDSPTAVKDLPGPVDSFAEYAMGQLLFIRRGTLVARPFDLKRLAYTAEGVTVAEQVQTVGRTIGAAKFSTSETGVLVYRAGLIERRLTWFDRAGKRGSTIGEAGSLSQLSLSPDRRTAATSIVDISGLRRDIWLYDLLRGTRTRFSSGPTYDAAPVWSPDGSTIIFRSNRGAPGDLYRKPADGSRNEELLYSTDYVKAPVSFSPDGKLLAFFEQDPKGGWQNWILPDPLGTAGPKKPYRFGQTELSVPNPRFSPDGHWIAYESSESSRAEIYIAPFPGPGGKRQVSTTGATGIARWRPDGKELFYTALDGRLMSAQIEAKSGALEVKKVEPLFGPITGNWDISADGQRFLVAATPEGAVGEPLSVIQNWPAGLKK